MKRITLLLLSFIWLLSCNKVEHGSPDNETISKRLFDSLRDNDFEKTESLFPDKGTYRKIMEQATGVEPHESAYDSLMTAGERNFDMVRSMLPDWTTTNFSNTHQELSKREALQFGTITSKFELKGEFYKFSFTSAKYNNRWFYLGDMIWVAKSATAGN